MASGGVVTRYPQGFTGLIGLQNNGDLPHSLATDCVMAIDASVYYVNTLMQRMAVQAQSVALGAAYGTTFTLYDFATGTIPLGPAQGAVWFVRYFAGSFGVLNTANTTTTQIMVSRGQGPYCPVSEEHTNSTTRIVRTVARDFWLLPGDYLQLYIPETNDTANKTFTSHLQVAIIPY